MMNPKRSYHSRNGMIICFDVYLLVLLFLSYITYGGCYFRDRIASLGKTKFLCLLPIAALKEVVIVVWCVCEREMCPWAISICFGD
jgi:hypothetical protein